MYLRLAQSFWNLDNYKTVSFEEDTVPGSVKIELDGLDGKNEDVEICFIAEPSDFRFNTKVVEILQNDFIEALNQGRGVFNLDEYFGRFDVPQTNEK